MYSVLYIRQVKNCAGHVNQNARTAQVDQYMRTSLV